MKEPKTLQDAIRYFSDEQTCIDTVAALRWPDGVVTCPACEGKEHYYLKTQKRWKCKACGRQFSVKLGTIFEDSPIKLDKWLTALWMLVNCKNGVSSYEIHRAIGVTQKSAWFMMHRLRSVLKSGSIATLGGSGAPVEVDETFIGGKAKNMHTDVRKRRITRRGAHDKTIVFGMLERGGTVRAQVIPNRVAATVEPILAETVADGCAIHSDKMTGYNSLREKYMHEVVDHAVEYVRGQVHTNGMENFWSLLKRGINGTYVAVEPCHIDRYLDEQVFRFNHRATKERKINDADRFIAALSQIAPNWKKRAKQHATQPP